jgi:hypothetical protein
MAIKVNGTNVITDGRALNNITSVDATTAAAIGAGGVGGGFWSLESTTTISANSTYVGAISLPTSDRFCMVLFDGMYYGASASYYQNGIQLSTNGGSSYYTGASDYKRYDGSDRDMLMYRESAQDTSSQYRATFTMLFTGLPSGETTFVGAMWGKQFRSTGGSYGHEFFESTRWDRAWSLFNATTTRPNAFRLTTNSSGSFDGGTIKVFSYAAG